MENKNVIQVDGVFATWNPTTNLYEAEVYAENGVIKGFSGETYYAPMTANSNYRQVEIPVKKGENVHELRIKEILSEPKKQVLRWRISKLIPHSEELIEKFMPSVLATYPNEIEIEEI